MPKTIYQSLIRLLEELGIDSVFCELPAIENVSKARAWLLDTIPKNSYIIGHSLGGQWALEASERAKSVFCVATNPSFIKTDNNPGVDEEYFNFLEKQFDKNTSGALKLFKRQVLKRSEMLEVHPQVKLNTTAGLKHLRVLNGYKNLMKRANKCTMWFAENDPLVPFEVAAYVQNQFNVNVITNSGGHFPMLEHPERFSKEIIKWLTP